MKILSVLVLCALGSNVVHAQFPALPSTPSVPGLLDMIEAKRYSAIPRGKVGAMALSATIRGFSDAGCQIATRDVGTSLPEIQRLTQALTGELGGDGVLASGFYQLSPNYLDVLQFVGKHPCASKRTQTALRQLVQYLRARFDPNAPLNKSAPVSAPARKPITEADTQRQARNGCERARRQLTEIRKRDRGDARSAAAIERRVQEEQRLCAGL